MSCLHVLLHHRRMKLYEAQRLDRIWRENADPPASKVRVGIMGLGVLGLAAAAALAPLGFQLGRLEPDPQGKSKESKRSRERPDLVPFSPAPIFLFACCHLPKRRAKSSVYDLLRGLARDGALGGPALINAGRGGLQLETDILRALEDETLTGASLDVFEVEPLPTRSPMWDHPKIYLTPHNAAQSDPHALTKYVIAQIERDERGLPLENVVDRRLGY